jgi:hypothetical protein
MPSSKTITEVEPKKVTAKDMEKYLAERYCDSLQWVFLTQVRSSTGGASRIADAMAFNMYGSTGYEILGFEIKVSRSDWLSELKQMSKSDEIMGYCDKWFLVVSDASIVQEGELPKNWGLIVLKDGKLVQKVRAVVKPAHPMPMYFIASILRRSGNEVDRIRSEYIKREDVAGEIEKARKMGYDDARGYSGRKLEDDLKKLNEMVKDFEKATGLDFSSWRGKEYTKSLGVYVKLAMEINENRLDYDIKNIEYAVKSLQDALGAVNKFKSNFGKGENHV